MQIRLPNRRTIFLIYCALALILFAPAIVSIWRLNQALDKEARTSLCKEIPYCVQIVNEVQIDDAILWGTPTIFVQVTDESKIQKEATTQKLREWVAKLDDSKITVIYQQVDSYANSKKSKRKI